MTPQECPPTWIISGAWAWGRAQACCSIRSAVSASDRHRRPVLCRRSQPLPLIDCIAGAPCTFNLDALYTVVIWSYATAQRFGV